jgi:molybdopterin-guanine dinucleotide biosynthesis protein B
LETYPLFCGVSNNFNRIQTFLEGDCAITHTRTIVLYHIRQGSQAICKTINQKLAGTGLCVIHLQVTEESRENMTIPIVSIVGKSNSGKTTLLEKIIADLVGRGYRVATIKHNRHGFNIDHEGKDSYRHKQAGAHTTVVSSPHQIAIIQDVDRDQTFAEIRDNYIREADIILTEGFKVNDYPKIEVFRSELKRELISKKEDGLIAVASDVKLALDVPCLDINDTKAIADFIENNFLK